MPTLIYSTNLRWESEITFYYASAIWVCGKRIQLKKRTQAQVYHDLKQLIQYLKRYYRQWVKHSKSGRINYTEANMFYIEVDIGNGETKVPVDHIGVIDSFGKRYYEIHGVGDGYVTRTCGLRDKRDVMSKKLISLIKQLTNRYKSFSEG